jgi:hypothetical protein
VSRITEDKNISELISHVVHEKLTVKISTDDRMGKNIMKAITMLYEGVPTSGPLLECQTSVQWIDYPGRDLNSMISGKSVRISERHTK